jgi:hypothetical protein
LCLKKHMALPATTKRFLEIKLVTIFDFRLSFSTFQFSFFI